MRRAHTVAQVRDAEARALAAMPEGALMQRAAAGLAAAVTDLLGRMYGARVLLLVGGGDNGGDALYAGARLARRGASVEAVLLSEHAHPAGLAALREAGGRVVSPAGARQPDLVIDGIVGIGGRPGLGLEAKGALSRFAGVPIVAVDVPSGVGVDTGELPDSHVTADVTVTFGTLKVAHLVDPAARVCGTVQLVDLGLDLPEAPVEALQPADMARLLPLPDPSAQKYTRGVVGVRTGSAAYPGAAVLGVSGADSGLAGMVRYAGAAADAVRAAHPDVVVGEGRVQCWVVGSGGDADAERALAEALADPDVPLVVDADALSHLPVPVGRAALLTPHAGELAELLGKDRQQIEDDQLGSARYAAERYQATVLLKGRRTLVAAPGRPVRVTTSGVPWLAVAGAGDVLAGLCGSLVAAGLTPYDAGSVGSWLHGAAATLASRGGPITAPAVAEAIPEAIRVVLAAHPSGLRSGPASGS